MLSALKNNFSAGELSPLMVARNDFERYQTGAKRLENWLVLPQGGLRTRYGTRFVAWAKRPNDRCRLLPFEASGSAVYVLEIGHLYIRFFTPDGPVVVDDVPVEVVTPYTVDDLPSLRAAQANDIMFLVHSRHPPAQLSRVSPTSFHYQVLYFDVPPLYAAGETPNATLTPSARTGSITLTASASSFLVTDIDRVLHAGDARVVLTGFTSALVMQGDVLSAFATTDPIPAGEWRLAGSPIAELLPSRRQPEGATITLDLRQIQSTGTNLVSNGTFAGGFTNWTNLSGPLLTTGTHTGGDGATFDLVDSTQNFYSVGVQPGHLVFNVTDGSRGLVGHLRGIRGLHIDSNELRGGATNNFNTGDAYEVRGLGGAEVRNGRMYLTGNVLGIGWIEQDLTTVVGTAYRVTFQVSEAPVSAQVGSMSGRNDVREELLYEQGTRDLTFVATTTTTYLQFRNNQPLPGAVDAITCRRFSVNGWRESDVGKYVDVNGGLVRIETVVSPSRVTGTLLRTLTSGGAVPGGAWRLLEPAWSATLGWPSVLAFFEGRLYLSGVIAFPQTIWASKVNDFTNFFLGTTARDALELHIVESAGNITLNQTRWLAPGENLLVGTTYAEYRCSGPLDGAFSAVELPLVRLQSTFGSAEIAPIRVGRTLLFVQRQGSALRGMAYEADVAASFLAANLTNVSGHLLARHRILDLAYQPEQLPLVWAVRDDGQLLTLTYDQAEEVIGWSRQITEGDFESVACVPHPDANTYQTWVSVQRTLGGRRRRCIEYIDDQALMYDHTAPLPGTVLWQGLTLDSAVTFAFTGLGSATLTGLTHLVGATVHLVGDGMRLPPQVVPVSGELTLPLAVQTAWVGLPFTALAETLPIETQLRTGTTHGHTRSWMRLVVQLHETLGLHINGQSLPFRTPAMPTGTSVPLFTGPYPVISPSAMNMESTVTFTQEQPFPATVLALTGDLDIGDLG